ncbi:hypothetical protein ESCO_001803 [Escovopsis weberi]|uniref:Protein ZIP4 homolog n=1 Tax=Escovopsis weberi TaxID=150374 RepID=A0A0M8N2N3_ESCWE|nr:hypothetical protein ESCO_001803 [Escovopsis weberi]
MPGHKRRLLLRARLLGFQLLELGRGARRRGGDAEMDTLYLINLAVSLGRNCFGDGDADLDAARFVLRKMAEYVERLKDIPGVSSDPEGRAARCKFEAEYLAMRTALAWKEGRLDVAEHMFSKGDALSQTLDVPSAEIVADTLNHIGSDLAGKGDHVMAIKWLRRGYDILNHQPLDRLSANGLELRLSVCQGLFKSLLDEGSPPSIQEAGDLVAFLEMELGDLPVILHWRLELLQKVPGEIFDLDAYVNLLRRLIRSFDFSDGTFHFLLHHVRGLREKSARLACCLLDELLQRHVFQSNKVEWLNKIVVWRVWISTMDAGTAGEAEGAPADVMRLLDSVRDNHPGPLTPDISAAVHSLIWKRIQALFVERNHGASEAWCRAALHEILSSSGETYLEVFQRKLIICAIGLNDVEKARGAFQSMKESARNHILTRYLMFKVSLLSWDHELGRECIEKITAQHAQSLSGSSNRSRIFPVKELNWFRKTAYNIGAKNLDAWELRLVIRIFASCLAFNKCYPSDMPLADVSERALMSLRCHFVIAVALVASARASDVVDEQARQYLGARHHIGNFDSLLQTEADAHEEPVIKDLVSKFSTLSVFDFEAATQLENWDHLNEIVRKAKACKDEATYKAMGDCLLRSKAPGRVMFATMRLIITEIYELEDFDREKMAKYIRCVFQAILPLDDEAAIQLLDQALGIAKAGKTASQQFPDTELEWLVAVAFNHAIELYSRGEEAACHTWALKAMNLAACVDDDGRLRDGLETNFAKLRFDGPDRRMW